jgi:phosphoribosyl-dephospho-CoA transferase
MEKARARTNEETRQLLESIVKLEKEMGAGVKAHPQAVRWTTASYEKGYPLTRWSEIEVFDNDNNNLFRGTIDHFLDGGK